MLVTGVVGCRSNGSNSAAPTPTWPYEAGERPRFTMLYLPYAQNGAPLAMPSPTAYGWTDERMERDLSRLLNAGLDGLILGLQPTTFADPLQTERVLRFLDLVEGRGTTAFEVTLLLVPTSPASAAIDAEAVGRWLATHDLQRRTCLRQQDGRVMLVCPPGMALSGPPHPALYTVRIGMAGAAWAWGDPGDPARSKPTGADRQVLVYAGWRGRTAPVDAKGRPQWDIERQGGRALEAEVRNAFNAKAGLICISSWNNYVTGDFIEPNSLDGDAVLRRLTALIRQARETAAATPAPPGGGSTLTPLPPAS
jgi:hypothetical protein